MTQFENGAVFAMRILKEVMDKHDQAITDAEVAAGAAGSRDLYGVLSGVRNVTHGLRAAFESKLMPALREAQAEPSPEVLDQIRRQVFEIQQQATRKKRASGVKHLLEGDLEIIESRANSTMLLLDKIGVKPS